MAGIEVEWRVVKVILGGKRVEYISDEQGLGKSFEIRQVEAR